MSRVDHLAKARDYLARGEEFYARAADEIIAAQKEDPQLGQREIAERLGRGVRWVNTLVQWRTSVSDPEHPPFGGPAENEARYDRQARTALKDPDRRRKALADLDTREVEQVARDAHDEVIGRARAQRREHQTDPTIGELVGGEDWLPGDNWADGLILSVLVAARKLAARVKREGLVIGSRSIEEVLAELEEAEHIIGEVRAAAQERMQDEVLS